MGGYQIRICPPPTIRQRVLFWLRRAGSPRVSLRCGYAVRRGRILVDPVAKCLLVHPADYRTVTRQQGEYAIDCLPVRW